METWRRIAFTITAALVMALVFAGSAAAAQRFAAPGGGAGPSCPELAPCGVETAIEGASPGDEVIIGPGTYVQGGSQIEATAPSLDIHGTSAQTKPLITSTAQAALTASGPNTVLRNIRISHTPGGGLPAALLLDGTTAEQMEVTASGTLGCVVMSGATLRDSTCRNTGNSAAALAVFGVTSTIGYARNVTAVATGASSWGVLVWAPSGGTTVQLDGRNIVAQGLPDIGTITSGSIATATMSYSDYATTQPPNSASSTITPAGTATNITAVPVFVDPASGDYRQQSSSPTVNAGAVDGRTGTLDFQGDARVQGTAIDIGGDEFNSPAPVDPDPPPTDPADTTPPQTTINAKPKAKTKSKTAKFLFSSSEAGSTFTCKLDRGSFAACTSPKTYGRLKKGRHTFSVIAKDAAGNADASPATYTWTVKKKKRKKR